jgi:hypothetical protein
MQISNYEPEANKLHVAAGELCGEGFTARPRFNPLRAHSVRRERNVEIGSTNYRLALGVELDAKHNP